MTDPLDLARETIDAVELARQLAAARGRWPWKLNQSHALLLAFALAAEHEALGKMAHRVCADPRGPLNECSCPTCSWLAEPIVRRALDDWRKREALE